MTPKKKTLVVLLATVLVATVAYVQSGYGDTEDHPTVERGFVSRGAVTEVVRAIGTLQPLQTVRIGSQVSSTVTALHVDFNSVVTKGQVLAELDPSTFEMQVAVQQANIARQTNDIASQRVQLSNDQKILERTQAQFDKGLISPQQLETAALQVKTRTVQIVSAERMRVQTEAQLSQAKLNLSFCTITSPIDGVVVSRFVDVGQAVQASVNTPQFFTLASALTTLRLAAGVDEADIGRIRPGMPVTFTVDSHKDRTFMGRVEAVRLNAQIQNSVVTYPVWIEAPNPDLALLPSMTANLQIIVESAQNVLRVPNDALKFRPTSAMYSWLDVPAPPARSARPPAPVDSETQSVGTQPDASVNAPKGRIDELFAAVPKKIAADSVWVYDEGNPDSSKKLREIPVHTGLTDGQVTELVSGDLRAGIEVVTGVLPPPSALKQSGNSIFGGSQRGFGGMTREQKDLPTLNRGGRPARGR